MASSDVRQLTRRKPRATSYQSEGEDAGVRSIARSLTRRDALPREFYARPTLVVARELLGKLLVHGSPAGETVGRIVEVEAYIGEADPACHAAPGPTRRNAPLYGEPGYAYVYINYGIHYLLNAVTQDKGDPAAVLIRALEPVDGIDLMRRRRARGTGRRPEHLNEHDLCRGPGNLTRAFGISLRQNQWDLCGSALYITDDGYSSVQITWSSRIGITVGTDKEWRCYVASSPAVSGKSKV